MLAVLLTIHILVCVAMIGVILLQRSEGGGLGLGTGGGVGGLMTGRGAANALTRTTVIFAAIFISTSIALTLVAKRRDNPLAPASPTTTLPATPAPPTGTTLLPGAPKPASESAPANPSATPVPATPTPPAPAAPPPAAPTGTAPAPSSGGGN